MAIAVRDVILDLVLTPVFWEEKPEILISFNDKELLTGALEKETTFNWKLPAEDSNRISVFFLNKKKNDTAGDRDKAVIIKSIGLEGLNYGSFLQKSQYRPEYSAGYLAMAREKNLPTDEIINSNYLGFNGEWWLEFTWPTFLWIFQTETQNQGWIYEKNI
jgi:hypothetical protein